jgi:predicted RNA-binding protein (virulence factor B family)
MVVREVVPDVGAFLDWGLPKDLLLPFREQGSPVRPGQRVVVAVCVDERTDRIIASTRIDRHFRADVPALKEGQEVGALVWARTDLGWKVIVDGAWRGLLFGDASTAALRVGQTVRAWVRQVREDRKVDLALDPAGYQRVAPLADQVMAALAAAGGRLEIDDDSPPAAIRARFGASKKAFKQALGALYRERKIEFTRPGIRLRT